MEKVLQSDYFCGVFTAIPTPLRNNRIDWESLDKIIQFQIDGGVDGLVLLGSTGERLTLSLEERNELVAYCLKYKKDIKIIVGIGTGSTDITCQEAKSIVQLGAESALVIPPYYNLPSQEGIYQHFSEISRFIPIILYNIPKRTGSDIMNETIVRLAQNPNIFGIKDSTGDLTRPLQLRLLLGGQRFIQLSGEDSTFSAFLAQGGDGIISVLSNIQPKAVVQLYQAWKTHDIENMVFYRDSVFSLIRLLFLETNPVPVKYIMSRMGLCSSEVRLPLLPIQQHVRKQIDNYFNQ